ncbi:MAG: flagellar type III secretion system pore protein FliP, partial [Allorhizobium sp.]
MIRFVLLVAVMMMAPQLAVAQQLPTDFFNTPIDGSVAAWIIRTFGLLTVLSIAPGILIMVTSFPRFLIAFSILRSGMGLSTTPSNMILTSMALFMTFYVMAPTMDRSWREGVQPLLSNQITEGEAVALIAEPFRTFMTANTRDKD